MNRIEQIYNKFLVGDSLTDEELALGHEHFQKMADMLLLVGPRFVLPCMEAFRVANDLKQFIKNREEKETRYTFDPKRSPAFRSEGL